MNKHISDSRDYFAVSTYDVYGSGFTGSEEWIIVSDRSCDELLKQYPESMKAFSPFILLSTVQWCVFENEYRLNDKLRKQGERHELKAKDVDQSYMQERWSYQSAVARYEEMMDTIYLNDAWKRLTAVQRRRMQLYFFERMTLQEIAEIEMVSKLSVRESIESGKRKIKDYFNDHPNFCPSSVHTDRRTK